MKELSVSSLDAMTLTLYTYFVSTARSFLSSPTVQGCSNRLFPRLCEYWVKNCVLLPAEGEIKHNFFIQFQKTWNPPFRISLYISGSNNKKLKMGWIMALDLDSWVWCLACVQCAVWIVCTCTKNLVNLIYKNFADVSWMDLFQTLAAWPMCQ